MVYTSIYQFIHGIYWYIPLLYIVVCTNLLHCCVQDTIVVVPPFPYCIEEDRHDVPLEDCWYARPQLFFTCVMRPKNGRLPKTNAAKMALMTFVTPWFSSVPLKSLTCL